MEELTMRKKLIVLAVFTMLVMTVLSAQALPMVNIKGTAFVSDFICGIQYIGPLKVELSIGSTRVGHNTVDVDGISFEFGVAYTSSKLPETATFTIKSGKSITVPVTSNFLAVNLHFRNSGPIDPGIIGPILPVVPVVPGDPTKPFF